MISFKNFNMFYAEKRMRKLASPCVFLFFINNTFVNVLWSEIKKSLDKGNL